jgi:hypothetical protein
MRANCGGLARRGRRRATRLPVRNQAVRWVVGRNAHRHAIADEHADLKLFHPSRQARADHDAIVEPDRIVSAGRFHHTSFRAEKIVPRHALVLFPEDRTGVSQA